MTKIYILILALKYRLNGILLGLYLNSTGCKVGRNLKCLRLPVFRDIPNRNITIGNNVVLGKGVSFEIAIEGRLELDDEVVIGDGVKLSTTHLIRIGKWSGIAENSSLRGSHHGLRKDKPYMTQSDKGADIIVGMDVLIGANVVILSGVDLPDGVVIGALSLVNHHDKVHPYGIFAGSPLKHIRDRQ